LAGASRSWPVLPHAGKASTSAHPRASPDLAFLAVGLAAATISLLSNVNRPHKMALTLCRFSFYRCDY
jgi:hypothetical protein